MSHVPSHRPEYEVLPTAAKALLEAGQAKMLLIDCRTKEEFDLVHLPGAVHIPLHEIEDRADEAKPTAAGQMVAVICHHGVRSLKAALTLRALGVPGAMSVAGGMELWSRTADAGVPRYERDGAGCRLVG